LKYLQERDDLNGMEGSCVCVVLIHGNTVYAASVGDSQAILCRAGQYWKLTYPHTPRNQSERSRVLQVGGKIKVNILDILLIGKDNRLCHPVWNPSMVNIAVTRALGDVYFKDKQYLGETVSGLISEPEITKVVLTTEDSFLFLASDGTNISIFCRFFAGYWDVVTAGETVTHILQLSNIMSPPEICQQLTQMALQRSSNDNITALLVNLLPKK
jgi:serine/threonine protein phosphatase PrpC